MPLPKGTCPRSVKSEWSKHCSQCRGAETSDCCPEGGTRATQGKPRVVQGWGAGGHESGRRTPSRRQGSRQRPQGGPRCRYSAIMKCLDRAALDSRLCGWGPQTLMFSVFLLSAHCLGHPCWNLFSFPEAKGKKNPTVSMWMIPALCSVEPSVWIRFVKLGDFGLRPYAI